MESTSARQGPTRSAKSCAVLAIPSPWQTSNAHLPRSDGCCPALSRLRSAGTSLHLKGVAPSAPEQDQAEAHLAQTFSHESSSVR